MNHLPCAIMKWFLLLTIVVLSSCRIQRRIYSTLPINNPSVQEKNDYSVNATISDPQGFDLNGGFAITNRLALLAGAYTHKNKDVEIANGFSSDYDSSNLVYRHNGFTLGAGVFFPLGSSSTYLSFYGGVNKGTFKMNEALYEISPNPTGTARINSYKSDLNRYFLQGSLNHYSNAVEFSATIRYSIVEYKKVITDYTDAELAAYSLPPFVAHRSYPFIDFSMDTRVYFSQEPRWGLHVFAVASTMMNDDDDQAGNSSYDYYPFRLGGGIFFRGFTGKKGK
jgi:hypothetical protein